MKVYGILVFGTPQPLALFVDPEQAEEWARENYFGQWLLVEKEIPDIDAFTPEEWKGAEQKGKEMMEKFRRDEDL